MKTPPEIIIENEDVCDFEADVLVLKFAQSWHGADFAVAKALGIAKDGWSGDFAKPGKYQVFATNNKIKAKKVLFEGVSTLRNLTYTGIRAFAISALKHLNEALPDAQHIAMTMHGVAFGLDEKESFLSQLAGIFDVFASADVLPKLKKISVIEKNKARAQRMQEYLKENYFPSTKATADPAAAATSANASATTSARISTTASQAGISSEERAHIFVAMPFLDDMEDVFIFGIQGPIQEAGLLCERVDQAIFTGDIVERIKNRIETAKLVVADLTGANANVYLEVGYAWGKNVNTLLLCRNVDELKFDVKGQRCVVYSSINDLRKKLVEELKHLAK